jgi:hypothetical protein
VGAGARVSVGLEDKVLFRGRSGRAPGGAAVGAGAPLSVGFEDLYTRRCRWAPGGFEVGAGARLPVERIQLCVRCR